jgi:hypothetical protein
MAIRSKRSLEGYLLIDHSNSPGVSNDAAVAAGMPVGAGSGLFESATYTCSHCQFIVIIEPARTRDRTHCFQCDHDICDACGFTYAKTRTCVSFKAIAASLLESAAKEINIKEI